MIYIVCATQLLVIIGLALISMEFIKYLKGCDELAAQNVIKQIQFMEAVQETGLKAIKDTSDQAFKERELLLERVQHPQQTQAQAAGATGKSGISIVDEETEAREQGLSEEDETNNPIQPVKPLKPFAGSEI